MPLRRTLGELQVHDVLEGLSSRLQAQMELLQRIESASPAAALAPDGQVDSLAGGSKGQLASRRELLAQALEKLQVWGPRLPSLVG